MQFLRLITDSLHCCKTCCIKSALGILRSGCQELSRQSTNSRGFKAIVSSSLKYHHHSISPWSYLVSAHKEHSVVALTELLLAAHCRSGFRSDILLSLVRSNRVGHLRDVRRLIVAVSRARLGRFHCFFSACLAAGLFSVLDTAFRASSC